MLSHLYAAKHSIMQQIHNCETIINDTHCNNDTAPTLVHIHRSKSELGNALHNIECAIETAKERKVWPLVPPPPADSTKSVDTGKQ